MDQLGKEYSSHIVFSQLYDLSLFYDNLAYTTMIFMSKGTKSILNLDTHVFTSLRGTLDSIRELLIKGRINDAYALLRKYYDSTIINVYTNLYLNDHFNIQNFIVEQIDNWRKGTGTIPNYREISQYINKSAKLKPITDLLQMNKLYKNVRDRCNDHTHYNYYHNLLLNDNEIQLSFRVKALDTFSADLLAVFIQHFAYLFYLNDHYMMSMAYVNFLDEDITPEEGSQYWVSPFIQKAFDKWIKPYRPDIALEILSNTSMKLE
jgi:hypothetical protein